MFALARAVRPVTNRTAVALPQALQGSVRGYHENVSIVAAARVVRVRAPAWHNP